MEGKTRDGEVERCSEREREWMRLIQNKRGMERKKERH